MFQHTAARRRLVEERMEAELLDSVSTHSRPKAAGFNTRQNHTDFLVSTHSRPKAAGQQRLLRSLAATVSTHSRPKAAGICKNPLRRYYDVSTHSRPKAAGSALKSFRRFLIWFQHTAARRRLALLQKEIFHDYQFQHTAARRRLELTGSIMKKFLKSFNTQPPEGGWYDSTGLLGCHQTVSTHSRPKAAGFFIWRTKNANHCFNTQPPEGGWSLSQKPCSIRFLSPDFAKLSRKARMRV